MRAGRLKHRITLRTPIETQNRIGEVVKSYADGETIWAGIVPKGALEKVTTDQRIAESDLDINIRYNSEITTEHRLIFGTRIFEITGIVNRDMANRELILFCKETQT